VFASLCPKPARASLKITQAKLVGYILNNNKLPRRKMKGSVMRKLLQIFENAIHLFYVFILIASSAILSVGGVLIVFSTIFVAHKIFYILDWVSNLNSKSEYI